ncbi:hypothetical protein QBC37DRAFT_455537 [Rhypophila decipiens]|uniref:Uncharacterized protein n=1 Tax=Rhypophila decipiens TaxID=261697 RepID=A0AAN7BCW7_9PEZI|nr:hypothetical protein QBC37DRAFT_455537 [Rhypophila decipiens]
MATNPEIPFLNTRTVPEIIFPMPDRMPNFPPWLAESHDIERFLEFHRMIGDKKDGLRIETRGERIGLRDLVMWKQFLSGVGKDPEAQKLPDLIISDLKQLASRILGPKHDWPTQLDIKMAVEKAHIRFITTAYPIDAVLFVLHDMLRWDISKTMDASLGPIVSGRFIQGSGEGRVTIQMVRDALGSLVPPGRSSIEWMTTVDTFITPLERKIQVWRVGMLHNRLQALRCEKLAWSAPSAIFQYLAHRSRDENIDHWVRVLDYAYEKFGHYRFEMNYEKHYEYLDPVDFNVWRPVILRLERNKKFLAKPSGESSTADCQDSRPPAIQHTTENPFDRNL